ncbi:MAG: VOC family protein [Sphingomonadales bacterium]|nr:VOC family protein [Sphingomonadales bacterium]
MSRLLGNPAHQCYVYPDFDKAIEKFASAGIGPFFKLDEAGGMGDYRGEQHPLSITVAFVYSGDSCIEIITPKPGCISAYNEFLGRHPGGGLHHIAYYAADFDKALAMMKDAGKPLNVVVDMKDPATGKSIEIYCEPVGVDDPVLVQLMLPGLFDPWFETMREAAANWDGTDPVRDARPSMYAAMAAYAA